MKTLHFENRQKNTEHLLLALAKIAIFPARAFAARDHMCCLSCARRRATSFLKFFFKQLSRCHYHSVSASAYCITLLSRLSFVDDVLANHNDNHNENGLTINDCLFFSSTNIVNEVYNFRMKHIWRCMC